MHFEVLRQRGEEVATDLVSRAEAADGRPICTKGPRVAFGELAARVSKHAGFPLGGAFFFALGEKHLGLQLADEGDLDAVDDS